MEISRNQFFLLGLVILFLGIEFRMVDNFVLTPEFTNFLAKQSGHPIAAVNSASQNLFQAEKPIGKKNFRPPEYLGWALLSVGSVLVLHSLAMRA